MCKNNNKFSTNHTPSFTTRFRLRVGGGSWGHAPRLLTQIGRISRGLTILQRCSTLCSPAGYRRNPQPKGKSRNRSSIMKYDQQRWGQKHYLLVLKKSMKAKKDRRHSKITLNEMTFNKITRLFVVLCYNKTKK